QRRAGSLPASAARLPARLLALGKSAGSGAQLRIWLVLISKSEGHAKPCAPLACNHDRPTSDGFLILVVQLLDLAPGRRLCVSPGRGAVTIEEVGAENFRVRVSRSVAR